VNLVPRDTSKCSVYSRFIHVELPNESKTDDTIFRWWQPSHGVADQWALDEIDINNYLGLQAAEDDFEVYDQTVPF
jgi:hypothetical protein